MTPLVEGFLLGAISAASLTASLFFLKFWRSTRDFLFLAFSAAFLVEGLNRVSALFAQHPNEGSIRYYVVRVLAFLLILTGILRKNFGRA